jgi:hypothetical protein
MFSVFYVYMYIRILEQQTIEKEKNDYKMKLKALLRDESIDHEKLKNEEMILNEKLGQLKVCVETNVYLYIFMYFILYV